jgi:hypothetical protein
MRSLVESNNKVLKGKRYENMGDPGMRSGRGFAFQYLVATLMAVSANIRKIARFFEKDVPARRTTSADAAPQDCYRHTARTSHGRTAARSPAVAAAPTSAHPPRTEGASLPSGRLFCIFAAILTQISQYWRDQHERPARRFRRTGLSSFA